MVARLYIKPPNDVGWGPKLDPVCSDWTPIVQWCPTDGLDPARLGYPTESLTVFKLLASCTNQTVYLLFSDFVLDLKSIQSSTVP